MIQDSMLKLWAKSDKYFMNLYGGVVRGRRLNVWDVMHNYFEQFKSIGTNLFSYEGITKDLAWEIEKRLFYFGRVGIINYNNSLTAVTATPNGFNIYDEPTGFSFAFGNGVPDTNKETPQYRKVGEDGVLGRNTFSFYPTAATCEQYALMLAHADISIIAELVNGRFMDVIKAHNNSDAETATKFMNELYDGKLSFIRDNAEEIEIDRSPRAVSHLRELIDTKDRLMRDFYNIFGIAKAAEKRERMITEEVETNEKMLNFNLKDMLEMRIKMCEEIERVFGVLVSVKSHIDIDADGKFENENEMNGGE